MARAPLSGTISMSDVNNALGRASPYNQSVALNDSVVRTLLGRSSGSISLSDAYGKPLVTKKSLTISTNVNNINLYNWAVDNGWDKSSEVEFTISAGIYVWSNNVASAAITTGGGFPGGLTIINNGYIMGMGGDGDGCIKSYTWSWNSPMADGSAGGPAISLGTTCSVINNGYIGGGGGGGGRSNNFTGNALGGGGGGAGGGNGGWGLAYNYSGPWIQAGGVGGTIGSSGAAPLHYPWWDPSIVANEGWAGAGGGRIMPGTGGLGAWHNAYDTNIFARLNTGGGAGGGGGIGSPGTGSALNKAGDGGAGGAAGGNGVASSYCAAGGGGGWGASGGSGSAIPSAASGASAGRAGGKAIALNGYYVTRSGSGTTYGAVS